MQEKKRYLWYLNTRFSRHKTGDKSLLTEFEERSNPWVTFGDDNKDFILEYGLIAKENVNIEPVALVDGLKHNLLSINQLCDNGNSVCFTTEKCIISNKETEKLVLNGYKKGNVYIVDFNSIIQILLLVY